MTRHVVKPFVAYNYGPGVNPGRFKCNVRQPADIEKLARAVNLLAGKMDIPQEWVRDQIGMREKKPGEALVINTTPAVSGEKPADENKPDDSDRPADNADA
jgi:phage gp29-like protein